MRIGNLITQTCKKKEKKVFFWRGITGKIQNPPKTFKRPIKKQANLLLHMVLPSSSLNILHGLFFFGPAKCQPQSEQPRTILNTIFTWFGVDNPNIMTGAKMLLDELDELANWWAHSHPHGCMKRRIGVGRVESLGPPCKKGLERGGPPRPSTFDTFLCRPG